MNTDITSKLSLNEMLRIFIPGIYLTMMFDILLWSKFPIVYNIEIGDTYKTIIFILLCLINGLLISSLDMPKKLWFFKNSLPLNRISIELKKNANNAKNRNLYFQFYDRDLSNEFKIKTEINNGYFLLCANLAIIAFGFAVIDFLINFEGNVLLYINIIISILSLLTSISLFKNKVIDNLNRQTEKFKESHEYKTLN